MRRVLGLGFAVAVAVASPAAARLTPRRLARLLGRGATTASPREHARDEAELALRMTSRLLTHTCYTRGITRFAVLRRAGFDVRLVFGVDVSSDVPDGHCWIVLDGRPYQEPGDPAVRFTPVWSVGGVA